MTTTMIAPPERPAERVPARPAGRVSLTERAAMRVGLALILWSRDHAAREPRAVRAVTSDADLEGLRAGALRGLPVH